jgi:hypothetical protein
MKRLLERAVAANIAAEVRTLDGVTSGRARSFMLLDMPNGRRTRRITVYPRDIDDFLAFKFENYVILGDYVAIVDTSSGHIEGKVIGSDGGWRFGRLLQQLPGVEAAGPKPDPEQEDFEDEAGLTPNAPAENWRLAVEKDGISIEISPASTEFRMLFTGELTVKISGVPTSSHDTALEALERYALALLFDLDLVYGLPVQLARRRSANRPRRRERPTNSPKFPRNQYAGQALQLYQYGRAAAGLPLLEYLAYYQAVEYFFPFFAREQTVNAVRSQLLHPRFDALDDAGLNRLINLAAPAARAGMAEREQLRATVRAAVNEVDLREFIESLPEHVDHFCSKKQVIMGAAVIQLDGNHPDLRDQVADRIYAIRCRIVHAKLDGGGSEEVLLPSSTEADSLQSDIELLRLVAQRAIVARAARA